MYKLTVEEFTNYKCCWSIQTQSYIQYYMIYGIWKGKHRPLSNKLNERLMACIHDIQLKSGVSRQPADMPA